jgi:hypothetical protein
MTRIKVVPISTPDVAGKLNFVVASGPVVVCLIVATMATYVRFHIGRWPVPNDEPDTIIFITLRWFFIAALSFTYFSFPVWLLTTPWLFLQRRFRLGIARTCLYALPFLSFLVTLNLSTRLSDWLID